MADHDQAPSGADAGAVRDGVGEAAQLLVELSRVANDEWRSLNQWGVRLAATSDLIRRCADSEHFVALVLPTGIDLDVRIPLVSLSARDATDLADALSVHDGERLALGDMESGAEVAQWVLERDGSATLEVQFDPPWKFWLRSTEDHDLLLADWLATANLAAASPSLHLANSPASPVLLESVPVQNRLGQDHPDVPRPNPMRPRQGAPDGIAGALDTVADLVCWMHLAARIVRDGSEVRIALHEHQSPFMLEPDLVKESPQPLLRWATATPDPLREEALRHTLRLATASGRSLPNPNQTAKSAAQYLLLFAQSRSSEVLRARDAAMASVKASIAEVTASIDDSQREAGRDALAAVLSAVGLVAASSRLGEAATAAGLAVVVVTVIALMWTTTRRRISRTASAIAELQAEIDDAKLSPFLTQDDASQIESRARLEVHRRNRDRTRWVLVAVAVVAVISTAVVAALGLASPYG